MAYVQTLVSGLSSAITILILKLYFIICRLSGESISDVCRFNANAAKSVGRKDLVKTWSLLAMVMDVKVDPGTNIDESPWAMHPFGRQLIESL